MKRFLGRLIRNVRSPERDPALKVVHLPGDIANPAGIIIYSGPREADAWPALYLSCSLQRAYTDIDLSVVCRSEDSMLFAMLDWKPRILAYEGRPSLSALEPGESPGSGTLLFHPYLKMDDAALSLMRGSGAGIRITPSATDSPETNIAVRTGMNTYPAVLHRMCEILGIPSDTDWKPVVPRQVQERVSELMAPVSGRPLPYIAATERTIAILEKHHAEIPLRTVSLAGRNSEFGELNRELRAAVTAGASAVITDDAGLWADARALGVPTVGLDPSGSFMPWSGDVPAVSEADLVELWTQLLRRGW